MGLASAAIEGAGIPTVTLSMEDGMRAPRVLRVPFPYNLPMGPGEETYRPVAVAALTLIAELEGPGERAFTAG